MFQFFFAVSKRNKKIYVYKKKREEWKRPAKLWNSGTGDWKRSMLRVKGEEHKNPRTQEEMRIPWGQVEK